MIEKSKIEKGVINMFKVNMAVKKGERIIVVTDVPTLDEWMKQNSEKLADMVQRSLLAKVMSEIAREKFPDCTVEFFAYPSVGRHGVEPGKEVEEKMKASDVAVAVTSYSLSHTNARENATKAGTRIASMPTFEAQMFYPGGPMAADYSVIAKESKKFADFLTKAETATVKSEAGTNLTLSVKGRSGIVDAGIFSDKGAFGNLPSGEAFVAPVEGTANGKVVVEKGWFAGLKENMTLNFKNGKVFSIEGGGDIGDKFRELLGIGKEGSQFEARRNCAELGIGTNPNAKRPDNVLEAEKIRGTIHIGIGDNSHIGGKITADLHQDFVIPKATLILDGKIIMENGEFVK
ncbi:MAG: aminopeptidase [Candidatus Bathyarchaeia archaeon]